MRRLLIISLSSRGYDVEAAASGQEGIDKLSVTPFDILLLDLGLPDMDGTDVCRSVRGWSSIPIIVVSVRDQDSDKVAALDLGADDFVTKPFSIDELLARMRANLRRTTEPAGTPVITLGSLVVDLTRRQVIREGQEVHLTPTEFALLRVLVTHGGRVLTHRHLLREIRGPAYEDETALLRVHMVALRQKLAMPPGVPGYIATEPGIGYRLHI